MFISYRKFDIILYFIIGILIALSGKRYIYGGFIIAYSSSLLLHKFSIESPGLYKYHNITYIFPVILFISLIGLSLYVLSNTTTVLGKHKLLSLVFLILSLAHSIARNLSKNDIFKYKITKYISTLLFIVVLFTVGYIKDNQMILNRPYIELKEKIKRF